MTSVRRKILELESLIAPELDDPRNVVGDILGSDVLPFYQECPQYIEEKWSLILQKSDNLRVKQLIALMEISNIPQDTFCKILGSFSDIASMKNINLIARPLNEFQLEDIENGLQHHFDISGHCDSNVAIKSITHVLMKI